MSEHFVRRTEGLVVRAQGDEILILDKAAERAHCLQGDVARVWDATEMPRSLEQIVASSGVDADIAAVALAELGELDLLARPGIGRRALIRHASAATVLVSAGVMTIGLPDPAFAVSIAFSGVSTSCITANNNSHQRHRVYSFTLSNLTPGAPYSFQVTYTGPSGSTTDTFNNVLADSNGKIIVAGADNPTIALGETQQVFSGTSLSIQAFAGTTVTGSAIASTSITGLSAC